MSLWFDFTRFPTLQTRRLLLREITIADADAIFRLRSDYEVTRYNGGQPYQTIEKAIQLIDSITYGYREQNDLRWAITLKDNGNTLIGMCGYNYWNRQDQRGSIGYDLGRAFWGRGIMPEAVRAIIEFGFERMGLNRVEADTSVYNTASVRVLEKLGFQQEGWQREQYFEEGRFHDLLLFALLKREYKSEGAG